MLLAFILLGMIFGSDGLFKISFEDYVISEQICSIALIFIMFYGGFGTRWKAAKPVAAKAIVLASLGVILTAVITGAFCYFVLKISLLESFLIGSVISSTDAASVFSILRSKQLHLRYNTASLLEVESGSNDPCSYMLTVITLSLMNGNANGGEFIYLIFTQVVFGLLFGFVFAYIGRYILKNIDFSNDGFDVVFVFALAIISYAAPSAIGGNGYLSAYILGIVLGNSKIKNKAALVNFFDGITGLMQMLIFFLLGLLAVPSRMSEIAIPALLIALFLTFIARPLSVFGLMIPFKSKFKQMLVVSWCGLRGAASIVFAVVATVDPAYKQYDIFHIVFMIVLFSMLIQGSLLPIFSRKLDMIDTNDDVMKTFNDYSDEVPIQYIEISIHEEHPWSNKTVSNINFPIETILVLVNRGKESITPNGETLIMPNDKLILIAKTHELSDKIKLTEKSVDKDDEWVNKAISEIPREQNMLIIMVLRNDEVIIPTGSTILNENDVIVIKS